MGRVLLLLALLMTPAAAGAQRAPRCPTCARTLNLTVAQWRCLKIQLPYALGRRRDPRAFEVNGCTTQRRPLPPPRCPGCAPPRPIAVTLSFAQQRCLSTMLEGGLPARPVDLEIECGRSRTRR